MIFTKSLDSCIRAECAYHGTLSPLNTAHALVSLYHCDPRQNDTPDLEDAWHRSETCDMVKGIDFSVVPWALTWLGWTRKGKRRKINMRKEPTCSNIRAYPVYNPRTCPFLTSLDDLTPQPRLSVLNISIGVRRGCWETRLAHLPAEQEQYWKKISVSSGALSHQLHNLPPYCIQRFLDYPANGMSISPREAAAWRTRLSV